MSLSVVDQITEMTKGFQQLHLRDDGKKFQLGDLPAELFYKIGKTMPIESTRVSVGDVQDVQGMLYPTTKKAAEASRAKFCRLQKQNLTGPDDNNNNDDDDETLDHLEKSELEN